MKITRTLGGVPLDDAALQKLRCENEDARAVLARALARMNALSAEPAGGPPENGASARP